MAGALRARERLQPVALPSCPHLPPLSPPSAAVEAQILQAPNSWAHTVPIPVNFKTGAIMRHES